MRQRAADLLNNFLLPSSVLEDNISAATSRAVRETLSEAGLVRPNASNPAAGAEHSDPSAQQQPCQ